MVAATHKIGLALSGGGFRASLYHLGLVRFLRDAGLLSRLTHITSVSGGSIFAAHLVLNWDRYNGAPDEFDAAAGELLSFVRLDVRNRIARRFPLAMPVRWARRLMGRSNRKLTRTGLLEYHYEQFLYGDVSLFELPERPELHLLATNLSEGCLCSFSRKGLLMMRRAGSDSCPVQRIHTGLATLAMAVTASSAFPGFFPPLELTGRDVGATTGDFGRQAYTDGGVFDNLGVRMFRCLARPLLAETVLSRDDFFDFDVVVESLRQAARCHEETPLRRLAQLLVAACSRLDVLLPPGAGAANRVALPATLEQSSGEGSLPTALARTPAAGEGEAIVVSVLDDLLRHHPFQREPLFAGLKQVDPEADSLLRSSRQGRRELASEDQIWLNRHLFEAAMRQVTGRPCQRRLNSGLDCVLVSDVGKQFTVQANRRAGGLIRTSLRATDILMDRVWQLESESFRHTPGFVFAPISQVVEPSEDPAAMHPEIQRQIARIRTDLDRFSPLEISSLIRHGYCVGRKVCGARPELFGAELPGGAPWDPLSQPPGAGHAISPNASLTVRSLVTAMIQTEMGNRVPAPATVDARVLQASSFRRILGNFLDYRDWVSYVYVPILIPILILLPYVIAKSYERSHRINMIIQSLAQSSRDLEQMSRLLDGPIAPWVSPPPEETVAMPEPNFQGIQILQDMRILDLRSWNPAVSGKDDFSSRVYSYRRFKVVKLPDQVANNEFRVHLLATSPLAEVRLPPQTVPGRVWKCNLASSVAGQAECRWEASFDLKKVPAGDYVDLIVEYIAPGQFLQRGETSTTFAFDIQAESAEVTRWLLLPKGKEYRSFQIVRYKTGKPDNVEAVKPVTEYLADDSSILAYKLQSVDPGYTYEVTWFYK